MSERKKTPEAILFSRRLRMVMTAQDILSADIMRNCGMGHGQVSCYVNGWRIPGPSGLVRICKYLNCSSDFLLGLSESPVPYKRRNDNES